MCRESFLHSWSKINRLEKHHFYLRFTIFKQFLFTRQFCWPLSVSSTMRKLAYMNTQECGTVFNNLITVYMSTHLKLIAGNFTRRHTKNQVARTHDMFYLQLYRCFSVERFLECCASTVSGEQSSWISNSVFVAKIPSTSHHHPRYCYANFYYLTFTLENNYVSTSAFLRWYRLSMRLVG